MGAGFFSGLVGGADAGWGEHSVGEHVFSAIKTSLVGGDSGNRKMLFGNCTAGVLFFGSENFCGCISCVVYLGTMFSAGVLCHGSRTFADISSLSGGRVEVAGKAVWNL